MENIQNDSYVDEIRWLSYKKASGSITEEQDQYLTKEIENNDEAKATWQDAMSEFDNAENQQRFRSEDFMATPDWAALHKVSQSRKIRKIYSILIAACLIGAAAITSYFVLTPSKKVETPDQIVLTTASGDKIILADAGTINTDGAVLNNQNSSLSFTASTDEPGSALNTLTVPVGLDYKIRLDDGTLVWMNSATKLYFPFKFGKTREISLEGEAYFEIAQDANRPFIVRIPGGKAVRVLGTSFNVNAYEDQGSKVALISGAVSLKSGNDSVILKPGIQATVVKDDIITAPFDEKFTLSWREGVYHIKSQKLGDVVKIANRWYNQKIVIDDSGLANKAFSGRLDRNAPVTAFLDIAKEVVGFEYYADDSGTLHLK